jgi:hypothetical protein
MFLENFAYEIQTLSKYIFSFERLYLLEYYAM